MNAVIIEGFVVFSFGCEARQYHNRMYPQRVGLEQTLRVYDEKNGGDTFLAGKHWPGMNIVNNHGEVHGKEFLTRTDGWTMDNVDWRYSRRRGLALWEHHKYSRRIAEHTCP